VVLSRSGLTSLPSWFFAWLSGLARFLLPGLYEVILYTLSFLTPCSRPSRVPPS